ncbi:MAG: hypothetical protein K2L81_04700, partial [Muribaculaceae bacterium]|nr:hypothetical protein [Muribaculaceae bacterium]
KRLRPMKIITIERNPGQPIESWPRVNTFPDSSWLNRNLPLFIPDIEGQWTATPYAVLRISRLGKSIAQKFASRYYDAITIGLRINPPKQWRESQLSQCFDSAWVTGQWLSTPRIIDSVTINGTTTRVDTSTWQLPRSIEALSRWMTLKNGDQIAPCIIADDINIDPQTSIAAAINDTQVLHFNIR